MTIIPFPMSFRSAGGTVQIPPKIAVARNAALQQRLGTGNGSRSDTDTNYPPELSFALRELATLSRRQVTVHAANRGGTPGGKLSPFITLNLVASGGERRSGGASEASPAGQHRVAIGPSGVVIESRSVNGLFYGLISLAQLVASAPDELPCATIEDGPRFLWRGLHLDVGRHFFPVDDIKKFLDLMALYKLNIFHWHLTEDQGWRIEVPGRPELTRIGAWRTEKDGSRYGGYYTRNDIQEVITHAAHRHIDVIPELELPGHARAAIASYPELSCSGEPTTVWNSWGISEDVFCAGKESTFEFLEDVLREIAQLFPTKIIHIGGDECPKVHWKSCPHCQKRITDERLADEHELQSYVIKRAQAILKKYGKDIIGWDEILEGGLAPGAWVMSWRGTQGGIAAANAGHTVVMSPTSHCYLDYRQLDKPGALGPEHFAPPVLRLEDVYAFDPTAGLSDSVSARVAGGQANIWTEWMNTWARVEHMTFPRALALSEVVWSPASGRTFNDFTGRLRAHRSLLDAHNVAYCPDEEAWG